MTVVAWNFVASSWFVCRRSAEACAMQERAIDDGYSI
jgi:hypothetical protein